MIIQESFGEYIRTLRETSGLPLRKVASVLDIDPSSLSKIERGERFASKKMIPFISKIFNVNEKALGLILLSDKVVSDLIEEDNPYEILKIAEKRIKYLKIKKIKPNK